MRLKSNYRIWRGIILVCIILCALPNLPLIIVDGFAQLTDNGTDEPIPTNNPSPSEFISENTNNLNLNDPPIQRRFNPVDNNNLQPLKNDSKKQLKSQNAEKKNIQAPSNPNSSNSDFVLQENREGTPLETSSANTSKESTSFKGFTNPKETTSANKTTQIRKNSEFNGNSNSATISPTVSPSEFLSLTKSSQNGEGNQNENNPGTSAKNGIWGMDKNKSNGRIVASEKQILPLSSSTGSDPSPENIPSLPSSSENIPSFNQRAKISSGDGQEINATIEVEKPNLTVPEKKSDSPGILDRQLIPAEPPDLNQIMETGIREKANEQNLFDPPLGFTGRSGVIPRSGENADFISMEDRWRSGFPYWDRYGKNFPLTKDYPYKLGRFWDPFNQNVLKGDYPIFGQHTFLNVDLTTTGLFEYRQLPAATTGLESTPRKGTFDNFGNPNQFLYNQFGFVSIDLFHGDASFKPNDWRLHLMPAFNLNYLNVGEYGILNPNAGSPLYRDQSYFALQSYFAEYKLADLSPDFDFVSVRVGSQPFVSDFRGFIFADTNRAARIFGTLNANRDQYNFIIFDQLEKDTISGLNTFNNRDQIVMIANYFRQDFLFPGYTAEWSVHYNNDSPSIHYDKLNALVRPDPVGIFQPHRVQAVYFGFAGDGHMDRFNLSNAFYYVTGRDSDNPIAGRPQLISAYFGALELSYDRDWARFRVSGLLSSGDKNPNNSTATGFDSIQDNPNFAGGGFSFFQRQQIGLFGVNLVQRNSLIPDLRASKVEGQSNFVNPGLRLFNLGADFIITPKLKSINNCNFLWFDNTSSLQTLTFQGNISNRIGTDLSTGIEYRPLLSNNIVILAGAATLLPSVGYRDIYNKLYGGGAGALAMAFMEVTLHY